MKDRVTYSPQVDTSLYQDSRDLVVRWVDSRFEDEGYHFHAMPDVVIDSIVEVLNIPRNDILKRAAMEDEEAGITDEESLIELYDGIVKKNKTMVLAHKISHCVN